MAMSAAASGGKQGRRRRGGRRHSPIADINMTPFIDVMLVLLIIFMVAAPLLTVGVPLDLPQTRAAALNMDKQPLTISVRADGKIYLMETIAYGRVAEVMAVITAAGYRKVALVTETDQQK
jgi:biopolymer transport protein TolR